MMMMYLAVTKKYLWNNAAKGRRTVVCLPALWLGSAELVLSILLLLFLN